MSNRLCPPAEPLVTDPVSQWTDDLVPWLKSCHQTLREWRQSRLLPLYSSSPALVLPSTGFVVKSLLRQAVGVPMTPGPAFWLSQSVGLTTNDHKQVDVEHKNKAKVLGQGPIPSATIKCQISWLKVGLESDPRKNLGNWHFGFIQELTARGGCSGLPSSLVSSTSPNTFS